MNKDEIAWVKSIDEAPLKEVAMIRGRWGRMVELTGDGESGLILAVGRMEPGTVAGWHDHPEDEVFLVFQGRGKVRWRIGDQEFEAEVGPGSAFFKRGGIPHNMEVTGDETLVGVGVKA